MASAARPRAPAATKPSVPEPPFRVLGVGAAWRRALRRSPPPPRPALAGARLLREGDAEGGWQPQSIEAQAGVFQVTARRSALRRAVEGRHEPAAAARRRRPVRRFGASAQPAPVTNSRMVPAQVQLEADAAPDERQAREWGLQPEEWRVTGNRCRPLGSIRPSSIRSRRWASRPAARRSAGVTRELQVQAEARRVGKTLAYQRAYDAAWQRLFPASRA